MRGKKLERTSKLINLSGKIAIVMNVKKFIGPAAATSLNDLGAKVICHDESFKNKKHLNDFAKKYPGFIPLSYQEPLKIAETTLELFGKIDTLISNDSFPAIKSKVEQCDLENLGKGLKFLVMRPYEAVASVVPVMKEQNSGKIILVTSAAPIRGLANYSMYATARGAANALTLSLSRELAKYNIQVNAVAPNYIESPSYFPESLLADDSIKRKIISNIPLGRLGQPKEVASLIAFLASSGGDFITGQIIPVDGGWS